MKIIKSEYIPMIMNGRSGHYVQIQFNQDADLAKEKADLLAREAGFDPKGLTGHGRIMSNGNHYTRSFWYYDRSQ